MVMNKIKCQVASKGIVYGKCIFVDKSVISVTPSTVSDTKQEIEKFLLAQKTSVEQLEKLYNDAILKVTDENAMVFKSHQMMIQDKDFSDKVFHYINVFKYNLSYAIFKAAKDYIDLLKNLQSEYMSQRADDVKDIMRRLIRNIPGVDGSCSSNEADVFEIEEQGILVTQDIMPSEILVMDKAKVLGIVTRYGGRTSHSSILAKNMKIPMLVGADFGSDFDLRELNGKFAILDGFFGEFIIEPEQKIVDEYLKKQADLINGKEKLKKLITLPSLTLDKKEVKIFANITLADDIKDAIDNGAQGIGLFRSEYLYMLKDRLPSEDELFEEYKLALVNAQDKEVVIRTIDIGSDKRIEYIQMPQEENPALGLRALRFCFKYIEVFKTQLRALLRASVYGNLLIMVPMIISVAEVLRVKDIIEEVKFELKSKQIPFDDNVKLGIMIETPSAVMISDLLARQVDFFSIGTNDLVQYTLACDRNNTDLIELYNPNHISVLRMIKTVVDNAHDNDIWVEVCGDVAADQVMTDKIVGLGVDRLSVDFDNLLTLKNKVRKINYDRARKNILSLIYPNN